MMKRITIILHGLIAGLLSVLLPAAALAGGLFLSEISGPEVGLASAGWAARAQNASTVFTNPAGMTRFSKTEIETGLQPIYLNVKFTADSGTTVKGKDGDASGWLPAGGLYLVHSFTPEFKMGFGVVGYFGLVLDFNDNWVGRYSAKYEKLQGLSLMPAAAYKVNDWLSIGGGMNFMYGMLKTKMAINNIPEGMSDGSLKLEDTDWGIGYTFGVMVEPTKRTRFGVTFLSEVNLDFETNPKVQGAGPILGGLLGRIHSIDLGMTVPRSVMGSFYHEFNDQWAFMGNLGWQQWSRFGKLDVDVEAVRAGKSATTSLPYKDTWHGALGIQFKPTNPLLLSFGISYDSSCIDDKDRSLILPVGEAWKFGTGARYRVKENLDFTMAYEFAWGGDMPVKDSVRPLGTVSGQYENAYFHFINLGLTWKF
jgi:long-chain fatty acid transport protein